jgi:putative glycosyltransferase (TIGR04372 family)
VSLSARLRELRVRVDYYASKIRVVGIGWTLRWIARRLAIELTWVALLPVTAIAHLAGYRRVPINVERIGHLASEFDCFLKERALGRLPERRWFVVAPERKVANASLLRYWKAHVAILQRPWLCWVLSAMGRHGLMELDISHYTPILKGAATYYPVLAAWGDRPPLLALDPEHRARGRAVLARMGVPADAWFVAIHAREPGFSAQDESAHAHRNSDIHRLAIAVEEIRRRGGWVVRMGDPSMQPFTPAGRVVDYALHPARSDWMDVFLCAEARFFVGNTSGLYLVATAFGTPAALANVVPSSHIAFAPADISVLKLIWSEPLGRYLTFPEIFSRPVANYRFAKAFADERLRVDENTQEELQELVLEMFERLDRAHVETDDDRVRQEKFFALIRQEHFCYGAASRVCARFLFRHRDLLGG